ncbi:MAG: hypothetical protein ACRDPC_13780 [Solirubrobacteraceae bacterium]
MPNPDPSTPRFAAIARGERAPTARVVDGDTGQTLAELPRAEAARYATQLELAARAGDALTLLAESSDPRDEDGRALEDTLDAFDRWHDELRARHRA